MKDIFNRRQRFSLRKYSFGVASVLLGTALFAAHTAQADEVTAPDASSSNPGTSVEGESSSDLVETSTASTAQADPTAVVSSTEATASTFNLMPEASTTDKVATETTDKQATETAKPEASKPASEAAKPTEKATSEVAKPATVASQLQPATMLKHQLQQEQLQTLQLQHQQLLQQLKILKQLKPQQKLQVLAHVLQQILTL